MAFTQILINRSCPPSSFEHLEEVVADHVGRVVYGDQYPDHAVVDAATQHGRLDTHMALKVEIDTEDLPKGGWRITESGLCVPPESELAGVEDAIIDPKEGLSDDQRNRHFAFLGRRICGSVAADAVWETGDIGWSEHMDPTKRLGVLVARAEGAWFATNSTPES